MALRAYRGESHITPGLYLPGHALKFLPSHPSDEPSQKWAIVAFLASLLTQTKTVSILKCAQLLWHDHIDYVAFFKYPWVIKPLGWRKISLSQESTRL